MIASNQGVMTMRTGHLCVEAERSACAARLARRHHAVVRHRRSQELPEFRFGQASVADDSTHREAVHGVVAWDGDDAFSVRGEPCTKYDPTVTENGVDERSIKNRS